MQRSDVERVARLANLRLEEDELDRFAHQLADILEHFRVIQEAPTDGLEPLVSPIDVPGRTRADEPAPFADRDALLDLARVAEDGSYTVPRVLE